MSITSGYNKYKRYTKLSDGTYKLVSQWTNSNTVEMDNGSTLQATLGNTSISGIGDGTVTGAIDSLNSNLGKIFYTTPISKYDDSVTLNATNTWQAIKSIGTHTYANKVHIMKLEAINATNSIVTISLGIGQDGDTLPEIIFGSAYVDPWKSISLSTLIHNPYDRDYVFFIKSGGKTVSYMKMEYLSFNMTSR